MKQYTIIHKIRISPTQAESLKVLKSYNVNLGDFIRDAIKEKIAKDWKQIKEVNRVKCPF